MHILYFSFSVLRSALASPTDVFKKNKKKNKTTSVYRLRHPRTSSYGNTVWTYNKRTHPDVLERVFEDVDDYVH